MSYSAVTKDEDRGTTQAESAPGGGELAYLADASRTGLGALDFPFRRGSVTGNDQGSQPDTEIWRKRECGLQ